MKELGKDLKVAVVNQRKPTRVDVQMLRGICAALDIKLRVPLFLLLFLPFSTSAEFATLDEFQALGEKFDHLTTGYALTGEHSQLDCGECHIGGVFEALPKECEACHDNVIAAGMPSNHVETFAPCDTCHTTAGFIATAEMDHSIISGSCTSCHDGVSETGKTPDHLATTDLCEACHSTNIWTVVRQFDHLHSLGSCVSCHNNVVRSGKLPGHMPTTNNCDACHLYSSGWGTVTVFDFDHGEVQGRCSFCHDGGFGPGKDADHEVTTEECNICHNTTRFAPDQAGSPAQN